MAPFADPEAVDATQPDPQEVARLRLRGPGSLVGSPATLRAVSFPAVGPGSAGPDASPRTSLIARPDLRPGVLLPPVVPPPPNTQGIGKPETMPDPAAPAIAMPTRRTEDEYQLNRLRTGPQSGIAGLQPKSTIGKIGKDMLRVGDAIGSIAAPGLMANIPGTSMHHALLENQAAGKVARDLGQEQAQAQTEETLAKAHSLENPTGKATDWDVKEGADAQGNPALVRINKLTGEAQPVTGYQPKPAVSRNPMVHETDQGLILVHPDGTATPLTMNGKPLMGKTPAGNFEEQAYQEWKQTHPDGTREQFAREYAADTQKPERGEEGSWQLAEDDQGNPILFNSKTAETKAAPANLRTKGTFAKTLGPAQDATNYANAYLDGKDYTGPGDEALMEKFFELAKPSTGFRMTQQQMDMLRKARDIMGGVEARVKHAVTPNAPWFSDEQRRQIVKTMNDLARAKMGHSGGSPQMIRVQIPGLPEGTIPADEKDKFLKRYPNAKVLP